MATAVARRPAGVGRRRRTSTSPSASVKYAPTTSGPGSAGKGSQSSRSASVRIGRAISVLDLQGVHRLLAIGVRGQAVAARGLQPPMAGQLGDSTTSLPARTSLVMHVWRSTCADSSSPARPATSRTTRSTARAVSRRPARPTNNARWPSRRSRGEHHATRRAPRGRSGSTGPRGARRPCPSARRSTAIATRQKQQFSSGSNRASRDRLRVRFCCADGVRRCPG